MNEAKSAIQPEFEWVDQQAGESIRFLKHGYPSPLVRWHYHKEYELHLIKATSGKVFVGDYIGNFAPYNLILVGPNLPHNWISNTEQGEEVSCRDIVVNFSHDLISNSEKVFPEMRDLNEFWRDAQYGLEFQDCCTLETAASLLDEIEHSSGFKRLSRFLALIEALAESPERRMLSSRFYLPITDAGTLESLNRAVSYIVENYTRGLELEEVAHHVGMSATYFSRFFRKATGNRFVEFVCQLRVNRACERLMNSEESITNICFAVGFNNISNFNRRFQAVKGVTPSTYRKLYLNTLCANR